MRECTHGANITEDEWQFARTICDGGVPSFAKHSWYFRNALVRANYKNARLEIDYTPIYLERFFRNLLLNDYWDLRNRYLHIEATDEWKEQPNLSVCANTQQVPNKYPTSAGEDAPVSYSDNSNVIKLVMAMGSQQLSVKQMMNLLSLKDRVNFLRIYLNPAIQEGYIRLLYPNTHRHPRQRYLVTDKGKLKVKDFME